MINWDFEAVIGGMRVGDSFFIPCLDCKPYRAEIRRVAEEFGVKVRSRSRVENYIRGLRVWRIL